MIGPVTLMPGISSFNGCGGIPPAASPLPDCDNIAMGGGSLGAAFPFLLEVADLLGQISQGNGLSPASTPPASSGNGCSSKQTGMSNWADGTGTGVAFNVTEQGQVEGPQSTPHAGQNDAVTVMKDGQVGIRLNASQILDIDPHAQNGPQISVVSKGEANSCAAWGVAHAMDVNQGMKKDPNNCAVVGGSSNSCSMNYGTSQDAAAAASHGYSLPTQQQPLTTGQGPQTLLASLLSALEAL